MTKQALKKFRIRLFTILTLTLATQGLSTELNTNPSIPIFIDADMTGWEKISFVGETLYKVETKEELNILHATSDSSASGFTYEKEIDISEFPYLNWSWKVNKTLPPLSEEEKKGDDYAARVYVIIKDGWFFWQTKALNYVWSSRLNPSTNWQNAYAPNNTIMLPLRSAKSKTNTWYQEKRNIYQDLKQWLGKEVGTISAIAIMTDSDDSQEKAEASYKDLYFSAE